MSVKRCFMILIILTACVGESLAAYQSPGQQNQKNRVGPQRKNNNLAAKLQDRPQDIVLFLNDVRSAPPEFAIDLLIRIAESERVADLSWKRELIEEAFRLAPTVQQPVKRMSLPSSPTDTRAGFLGRAFELNMDALSLQCRAVKSMLSVDKQKARDLFGEIPSPQLSPLNCEDALVYDVSEFYVTLKMIADTAFSQKEIKSGEPVRLVESYISQIVSSAELAPAIKLLTSLKVSRSQKELLLYRFSKALSRLSSDDRSFISSLYQADQGMKNLVNQCLQQGISADELLRAYRTYMIRHFNTIRCADNDSILSRRMQSSIIGDFNNQLRRKSDRNVLEITDEEIKPVKVEGAVNVHMHWQSPKSSSLLTKIKRLRFGSGKTPLTVAERETLAWQSEVDSFLKDMAEWKKEDEESEEDYFHQKCSLFRALIELVPRKTDREDIIRDFVGFLNSFDLSRGSRIEWFQQARFLLEDKPHLENYDGSAPVYIIRHSEMMSVANITKSPVLYLYLQLDKLLAGERSKDEPGK